MPCNSCGTPSRLDSDETIIKKDRLNYYKDAEAIACALFRNSANPTSVLDAESGLTPEMAEQWYKHHQEIDYHRKQQEIISKNLAIKTKKGQIDRLTSELLKLQTEFNSLTLGEKENSKSS